MCTGWMSSQKRKHVWFCHFQRDTKYDMCKLVDLTIADDISYVELNVTLEKYVQTQTKNVKNYKSNRFSS